MSRIESSAFTRHRAACLGLALAAVLAACQRGAEEPEAASSPRSPATRAVGKTEAEARVATLPYATWVPTTDTERRGVVLRIAGRIAPGLNLYNPRDRRDAQLVDERGQVVHEWTQSGSRHGWHHIEPLGDGRIAGLVMDHRIELVDWDSRLVWKLDARVHHDVAVTEEGNLLVPVWKDQEISDSNGKFEVLDEQLLELTPAGRQVGSRSLWPLFVDRIPSERLAAARAWQTTEDGRKALAREHRIPSDSPADLLHLNSVEVIDRDVPGFARRGDLLVSLCELDLIAVIDPGLSVVRWSWGPGELDRPHHPSLLADGHLLVFDNGRHRGTSRVVEVDPKSGAIVRSYPPPGGTNFFSASRGAAQRLANGDTLITESNSGRVFEVDARGEMVWEFLTPDVRHVGRPRRAERAAIYRMRRLEPDDLRRLGIEERLRAERRAGPPVSP